MANTIFEILSGQYYDETKLGAVAESEHTAHSIVSHLSRLLNARQGVLRHLPDYGLPDITEVYQGLPYSLDGLLEDITRLILKYEPRLLNVEVVPVSVNDVDAILRLEIRGSTEDGKIMKFETFFLSGGYAKVNSQS
ncbi:Uncharacterized protein similar to VCA0109 [hydrothermal vent metagenome]|uniref:Uncharacterized protein similar to VCA0109 n=1 Tax=hydrothermal vent metagenome TaxID=652676 RepID=A0A3B0Z4F3_9ZZZZ